MPFGCSARGGLVVRRAEGRMGYYRLPDGDVGAGVAEALECLRRFTAQHPERAADDDEP